MEEKKNRQTTSNTEFVSRTARQSRDRIFDEERMRQLPGKEEKRAKLGGWGEWRKKGEAMPHTYKKLLRNTAICALLAFGIWGIKSMDTTIANNVSQGIEEATSSEMQMDEDLGRLKFVNGEEQSDATAVSASAYSLPLEGEVVETFSETEKGVKIKSEANTDVSSILSGTVIKTTQDTVIVENNNSTQTTYQGLIPTVTAGDQVTTAQTIGKLSGEVLCLETVSNIGYVDCLSAKDVNETVVGK